MHFQWGTGSLYWYPVLLTVLTAQQETHLSGAALRGPHLCSPRSAAAHLFVSVAEADTSRHWSWHCLLSVSVKSCDCYRHPSLERRSSLWHHCSHSCLCHRCPHVSASDLKFCSRACGLYKLISNVSCGLASRPIGAVATRVQWGGIMGRTRVLR